MVRSPNLRVRPLIANTIRGFLTSTIFLAVAKLCLPNTARGYSRRAVYPSGDSWLAALRLEPLRRATVPESALAAVDLEFRGENPVWPGPGDAEESSG